MTGIRSCMTKWDFSPLVGDDFTDLRCFKWKCEISIFVFLFSCCIQVNLRRLPEIFMRRVEKNFGSSFSTKLSRPTRAKPRSSNAIVFELSLTEVFFFVELFARKFRMQHDMQAKINVNLLNS